MEEDFYWLTGAWAKGEYFKRISVYWQEDLVTGLEGISLRVLGFLGWDRGRVRSLLWKVSRMLGM